MFDIIKKIRNQITEIGFSKILKRVNKLEKLVFVDVNLMMNQIKDLQLVPEKIKPMSLIVFKINVSR